MEDHPVLFYAELVMCADSVEAEDLRSRPQPTVAVITLLVYEKYAVDIMMGDKTTWLKHRTDGMYYTGPYTQRHATILPYGSYFAGDSRAYIYTCGKIGPHCVVSSKISNKASSSRTSRKRQEAEVTDLLGMYASRFHIRYNSVC